MTKHKQDSTKLLTWEQWNSASTATRQYWLDNGYQVPLDEIEREYTDPCVLRKVVAA